MEIKNGQKVKDCVTGFKGTVTGICYYLTGCNQALVTPPSKEGKPSDSAWFDLSRLEVTDEKIVKLAGVDKAPGFDRTAPIR